jgi:hypothetical protein
LTWAADRARTDERFRRDLDKSEQAGDLLAGLVPALVAGYPQVTYLAVREQERSPRRQVRTGGVFGPAADVVCVTDFPPFIEVVGSEVRVLAGGQELTFKAKAEPALRLLLSGNPANVDKVGHMTGLNVRSLADTLLDVGICAELTTELEGGYRGLCSRTA